MISIYRGEGNRSRYDRTMDKWGCPQCVTLHCVNIAKWRHDRNHIDFGNEYWYHVALTTEGIKPEKVYTTEPAHQWLKPPLGHNALNGSDGDSPLAANSILSRFHHWYIITCYLHKSSINSIIRYDLPWSRISAHCMRLQFLSEETGEFNPGREFGKQYSVTCSLYVSPAWISLILVVLVIC